MANLGQQAWYESFLILRNPYFPFNNLAIKKKDESRRSNLKCWSQRFFWHLSYDMFLIFKQGVLQTWTNFCNNDKTYFETKNKIKSFMLSSLRFKY